MSLNLRPHSVSPRKSARIKLVDDESKIEETGINLEKIIHLKDLKIGILEAKYSDLKIVFVHSIYIYIYIYSDLKK